MEYSTQKELYIALLPVFRVKKRLNSITEFSNITNADIWKYLSITKWKNSVDLTISKMANDIITVDIKDVHDFVGGKK